MDVKVIATHSCFFRPSLEMELKELGIEYELFYAEEHPELVKRYQVRHSPNLIIDDEVVLRGETHEPALRRIFEHRQH